MEVSTNPKNFDSAFTMMLHSNFNFSSGKNITKIVVRQQNKTKTYIGTNQTDDTVHTNIEHIPVCRKIYLFFASFIAILYYFYILFEPIAKFMLEFWNISLVYSITSRNFAFARLLLFFGPSFLSRTNSIMSRLLSYFTELFYKRIILKRDSLVENVANFNVQISRFYHLGCRLIC